MTALLGCFYVATICGALIGWIARGAVEDSRKPKEGCE